MELSVAEAVQMDVGRAIARISSASMDKLGLQAGDTILIKGKHEAVATVLRARPEDEGLDIIRIDGIIRFNAGTSLSETVQIEKTETKDATEITLAPLEEMPQFMVSVRTPQGIKNMPVQEYLKFEIKRKFMERPFIKGNKMVLDFMGTSFQFGIKDVKPKDTVKLMPQTGIIISAETYKADLNKIPEVSYEDIGGLSEEIDQIREMVELPMKHPEVFERLGIGAPKGVLLSGPPGTGKTLLAKAVASETESEFYSIAGPEIMSKFYGESEKQLRDIFKQAEENAPSIVFIDEIDAIAPKREEVTGETERRIVAQLLATLDGLKSRGHVVVIAATNRPDALDPALRRPGRFDREIVINAPNEKGRKEILNIHTRGMPLEDVDIEKLAHMTIGYTGADLEALCKEAAMKSLKAYIPSLKTISERVPKNVLEKIVVKQEHFMEAFKKVEPSAMREVLIRKPNTKWSDIGGLENVKRQLKEMIEWPLKSPELFKKAGIRPGKGILLYGPPGTGKTLLAKAVANEAEANFIAVKGPELVSKWVGESEKHVRQIFKKARQVAPSIIFFDEFDSISQIRGSNGDNNVTERVVNQLLTELDGIEDLENVMLIAATNRPDLIDPGLLRPGRIDVKLEIPIPDLESRYEIFKVHTKDMPISNVDLSELAKQTDGMSGAEIESVCREAGMEAIRDAQKKKTDIKITKRNFESALETVSTKSKKEPTRYKDKDYIQ